MITTARRERTLSLMNSKNSAPTVALPRLLHVAGPIYAELALAIGAGMFVTWLVSRNGDASAAAFSLTNHITTLLLLLFRIVGAGIAVSVSNRIGAGDRAGAAVIARNSFAAALWAGLCISLTILLGAKPILMLLRAPDDVLPIAVPFMQAMAFAVILDALNATLASVLRAHFFVRDTLKVFFVTHILQVLLAVVLLPRYGLPGYAAAVSIAYLMAFALHLAFSRWRLGFVPRLKNRARDWWYVDRNALRPVLHVGIPAAAENVAYRLSFLVSVMVVGALGSHALATQAYVLQINYGVLLSSLAIGLGVEIIVGHLVGARRFKQARHLVRRSLTLGMCLGAGIAALAALVGPQLLGIFTDDQNIIAIGAILLWLNVVLEPGRSFNLIVINALRAAGDTRFPVVAGVWSMLIVLAGGSWFLCSVLNFGLIGVWIAYAADEWLRGLMMWWRWQSLAWVAHARSTVQRARIGAQII
jgi:putative MATE family efflux protein